MTTLDRTNGFKVRGLDSDVDRLAVQSTHQSTWFLTRVGKLGRNGKPKPKWHEIGIARDELVVLRPYGAAPVIELEGLGGPHGVLIVEATQSCTRTLRNGSRLRLALKRDETVVVKCEGSIDQRRPGAELSRV
jgi:hypothetical protein